MINDAIQDSVVTFSMIDEETGLLKVAHEKANIVLDNDGGCEERYILQYKWKKRDIRKPGFYKGWFEIKMFGMIPPVFRITNLIEFYHNESISAGGMYILLCSR